MHRSTPRSRRSRLAVATVPVLVSLVASPAARGAETVEIELLAGGFERRDTPVVWTLPEELAGAERIGLERLGEDGAAPVPCQRVPGERPALAWIIRKPLAAGAARRYRVVAGERPHSAEEIAPVECLDEEGRLLFRRGSRNILAYREATVEPPADYGAEYARSGYIHPVWNPSGQVVTNDFPPHHKHHHGIWFPWTRTTYRGRDVDFWNSGKKEGRVECTGVDRSSGGPVFGSLRVGHRFLDLTAPDGPEEVLQEVWELRVWAVDEGFLFDLRSTQTAAGEHPLHLHRYRYGGLGLRGSGEWEGPGDACRYLTSEGRTREDGHATRARWCDVWGELEGEATGILVLGHPSNFRFPEPMRIHPSEPFFNFAPCQAGDFWIRPGRPHVSRYRFWVHQGPADTGAAEKRWRDWAEPPRIRRPGG